MTALILSIFIKHLIPALGKIQVELEELNLAMVGLFPPTTPEEETASYRTPVGGLFVGAAA